jgi:periplasmic copper chaperone A
MSFLRAAPGARFVVTCLFATIALVAAPLGVALAHVVAQPNSAPAGSSFTAGFLVAHGCDGSPTITFRVRLPEGVTGAKQLPKEGWTVTESGSEIAWRGGSIDPKAHETFGIALTLPRTPGRTLYFPAIQECRQGTNDWIEIPAAGQNPKELRFPAPFVTLTPLP